MILTWWEMTARPNWTGAIHVAGFLPCLTLPPGMQRIPQPRQDSGRHRMVQATRDSHAILVLAAALALVMLVATAW